MPLYFTGTPGDDDFTGAGENDEFDFDGGGNDIARGGGGSDRFRLDNSAGALSGSVTFYGDAGDDSFFVGDNNIGQLRALGGTVHGGDGADEVLFYNIAGIATLGDGDDYLQVSDLAHVSVSLGAGHDIVHVIGVDSLATIDDFQLSGASSDRLRFTTWISTPELNWDQTTNPFTAGIVRLAQTGADTEVQFFSYGAYRTHVVLRGVTASALTAAHLDGYDPSGGAAAGQTIDGGAGDDRLFDTGGDDLIRGGVGADRIDSRGGSDTIEGGAGQDVINSAGGGDVVIRGGDDDDSLNAARFINAPGGERVEVRGENGSDTLNGSFYVEGTYILSGGEGNDFITAYGPAGATLSGGADADLLQGGDGDDVVDGGLGNDQVLGGAGDDSLSGGQGDDVIDGGDGVDTVNYSANPLTITVSLANQGDLVTPDTANGWSGLDYLLNIENVSGTNYNDKITGSNGANSLGGGGGSDELTGLGGDDSLVGGFGNDILDGGEGEDQLWGGWDNDTLRDGGETHNRDFLYGGRNSDTYYVTSSLTGPQDVVYEGWEELEHRGDSMDFDVIHSAGEFFWDFYGVGERLIIDRVAGSQIIGGSNNQTIWGNAGNDVILAYGGSNVVDAGAGTDAIGLGLYGLAESADGANTLVMKAGSGMDYVYDFESGVDKLDLTAFGFGITGAQVLSQAVNVDQAGAANDYCYFYLTSAGGVDNFVVFMGLLSSQLSAADFVTGTV